jgi:photosystem II stability/assembly factor-like uncharacterized protein
VLKVVKRSEIKMSDKTTMVPRRSRKLLMTSFTLASAMALVSPAFVQTKAYAVGNAYEWIKHEDQDLLGGTYTSVASSASGSHLIIGSTDGGEGFNAASPLYVSDDYGATWEDVAEDAEDRMRNYWTSVDVTNDGQTMVAASDDSIDLDDLTDLTGGIFISEDAGATWADISPAGSDDEWRSIAISGDGSKIVAVADDDTDEVFISDDSGATWDSTEVDNVTSWDTVAISDDGNKILVGGENLGTLAALVQFSEDGGDNWADVTPFDEELAFTTRVAMSSTGDKLAVSIFGYDGDEYDMVFISEDDGANWTDVTPDDPVANPWNAFAMSDNGAILSVLDEDDVMYISSDDGANWTEEDPGLEDNDDNDWTAIDFNATGSRIIAVSEDFAYSGYNAALDSTFIVDNAEDGKEIVLTLPSGTTITCHSPVKESDLSADDGAYSYPLGLVDFCFSGADASNEITLIFVTELRPDEVAVRKYNPANDSYATITEATVTETTYSGQHALQVTYTITDNGPLDTDSDAGEVADPVGLAVLGVGAPNTGLGSSQGSEPSKAAWLVGAAGTAGLLVARLNRKIYSYRTPKK